MPVFHTKIIESILEPVAQQVSRLVILHEEAEDGNAMPDLARPVQAVSLAVNNLVKVGHETIESSGDGVLRGDMPPALQRVEQAAALLTHASDMLRAEPFSSPARKKLIEGSRGILQGTSALLLCFDESEVRKIVKECRKVLEYLGVAEVIDTMEDLVQFLRDISPALSKAAREVAARATELTHPPHAATLSAGLERVKQAAPSLICAMKMHIHILTEGGKGIAEAAQNRNYLVHRMADEIHEIIRVLQLTSYVEDGGERDNVAVLRALQAQMRAKMAAAQAFLDEPSCGRHSAGERALRSVVESARCAADLVPRSSADRLLPLARSAGINADHLCDERHSGKGLDPKALGLSRDLRGQLRDLEGELADAVAAAESRGGRTPQARMEAAQRWLMRPAAEGAAREGMQAIAGFVAQAQALAGGLQGAERAELQQLGAEVQRLAARLGELCAAGLGAGPEAQQLAAELERKLRQLQRLSERALVSRVVLDLADVAAPLRLFCEAARAAPEAPDREEAFRLRAEQLQAFTARLADTGAAVAAHALSDNRRAAELLHHVAQVERQGPQLRAAGSIRLHNAHSAVAEEHFENLRAQLQAGVLRVRDLCDQALQPEAFAATALELMRAHQRRCEDAVRARQPPPLVEHTAHVARLANRLLLVAGAERDNSDEPALQQQLRRAAERLQQAVPPAVLAAKALAQGGWASAPQWQERCRELLAGAEDVERALQGPPLPPPPPPPLAAAAVAPLAAPPRPPPPRSPLEEEAEGERIFLTQPPASQPILVAAHSLHRFVRDWSSQDNDIVAAAKRMAVLMARLSDLVRSDSKGSKRELIATAKAIAEASEEVTRLAKQLALQCTDKRIRTNLLQVCERIPTIGTQLKILSTVKATMLGAQGSEEDQEATEMLVGNAQNLMQSVKETVKAAEGASIKIRSEQDGYRLRWVRRSPWYQI